MATAIALSLFIDPISQPIVDETVKNITIHKADKTNFSKFIEEPITPPPDIILSGHPHDAIAMHELGQMLGMAYPGVPSILLMTEREGFDRQKLIKNGFRDVFLVPLETTEFRDTVVQALAAKADAPNYHSVKIVDLAGDEALEFDVYLFLPLNRKYVKYIAAGQKLKPEQLEKMKSREVRVMFLRGNEMPKFYQFTAQKLVALGKADGLSETEKQERMKQSVRTIVSGVFTPDEQEQGFEAGKKVIKDCQEIVKAYLVASDGKQGSFYSKLSEMAQSESGFYSAAANISTFSALISMGLGIGKPDEVAMAGMLCDVGLSNLPAEVQTKSVEDMTPEELKIYQTHPLESLKLFKAKKMALSDYVTKIVTQHHEQVDGKGYPNALPAHRIMPEAQIVGIASEFAELIRFRDGKKQYNPKEAIDYIIEHRANTHFESGLLAQIKGLLSKEG